MEIYSLEMSRRIKNAIHPVIQGEKKILLRYEDIDEVAIGYYENKHIEVPEYMNTPLPMVSLELIKLLLRYEPELLLKPFQLFSNPPEYKPELYYFMM